MCPCWIKVSLKNYWPETFEWWCCGYIRIKQWPKSLKYVYIFLITKQGFFFHCSGQKWIGKEDIIKCIITIYIFNNYNNIKSCFLWITQ